ncbi:hypothetical protein OE88DRAFT_1736848 [Heliocybe sulcata]|uniref:Zn(2)-C6 fungal-type domain-containing protein n=1 Tax=Heliocybe sulcata TaxID=5364 RepID=A0A5C3MZI4_9AGAM|nr:hypothetical protein OE88DRAFT_1736848 [Heliocybe sulcata]
MDSSMSLNSSAQGEYSSVAIRQSRLQRPAAAGLNLKLDASEDAEHRRVLMGRKPHHLRHHCPESSFDSFPSPYSPATHSPLSSASTATFDSAPPTPSEMEDSWNLIPYNVPWGSSYHQYQAGTLPGPEGACVFLRSPTPLKNQRTMQACEKCRERKAKCSGDKPSCARCLARGHTCTYMDDAAKRVRGASLNRRKRRETISSYSTPELSDAESTDQSRRNSEPDIAAPAKREAVPVVSSQPVSQGYDYARHVDYAMTPVYAQERQSYPDEGGMQYEFPVGQPSIYAPRPVRHSASMPFLPQASEAGYYSSSAVSPPILTTAVSQYAVPQQPLYYNSYELVDMAQMAVYDESFIPATEQSPMSLYGDGAVPYDPNSYTPFAQPYLQ